MRLFSPSVDRKNGSGIYSLFLSSSGSNSLINIMVVDDDQIILDLFDAGQDLYNYRVVANASTCEEAIAKYPRVIPRPDIVLMDYNMPDMNGIECMKRIFQIDSKAKIVFISACVDKRTEALAEGAIDFVPKPFAMTNLMEQLNRIRNQ
ncbi:MAG: response regulator [Thermoplasmata archaeon]